MSFSDCKAAADELYHLLQQHETWRASCLNLCAAENGMSPAVRRLLDSDLAQRYGDYTGRDLRARRYFGTRELVKLEEWVAALAREVFQADHVELRPVSGHTAGNALMLGLCRPGDLVIELGRHDGGHRLATKLATSGLIQLEVDYLPFDPAAFNIDVERTMALVRQRRPRLVIVGASNFLFPIPLEPLAEGLREYPETILVYDASHVLGLIAGQRFQAPLAEGAQVVLGGTQKSFPGPQGAVIYSNSAALIDQVSAGVYPALLSNHHLARLPSLGLALLEMKCWGQAYADQVIRNAKALAAALAGQELPVVAADLGYTASHTILLQTTGLGEAEALGTSLDQVDIIVTAVRLPEELDGAGLRLGVAEITRRGAEEAAMADIARVIADALFKRGSAEQIRSRVRDLAGQFNRFRFAWEPS